MITQILFTMLFLALASAMFLVIGQKVIDLHEARRDRKQAEAKAARMRTFLF